MADVFDLNVVGGMIGLFKDSDPDTLEPFPKAGQPVILKWQVARADQVSADTPAFTTAVIVDGQTLTSVDCDPLPQGPARWDSYRFDQGLSEGPHDFNIFVNAGQEVNETNVANNQSYPALSMVFDSP